MSDRELLDLGPPSPVNTAGLFLLICRQAARVPALAQA